MHNANRIDVVVHRLGKPSGVCTQLIKIAVALHHIHAYIFVRFACRVQQPRTARRNFVEIPMEFPRIFYGDFHVLWKCP